MFVKLDTVRFLKYNQVDGPSKIHMSHVSRNWNWPFDGHPYNCVVEIIDFEFLAV